MQGVDALVVDGAARRDTVLTALLSQVNCRSMFVADIERIIDLTGEILRKSASGSYRRQLVGLIRALFAGRPTRVSAWRRLRKPTVPP